MRRMTRVGLCVASFVVLSGCAESGDKYYRPVAPEDYPKADGPGEVMEPGENETAARIAAIIQAHLERLYPNQPVRRDAHPKAHGCVEATVTVKVEPKAPSEVKEGIFAAPASYPAIIRFSSANEDATRSDLEKDGRGMAIKVFGIDKLPQPPGSDRPSSQDFIMINYPTFLVGDGRDYLKLVGYNDADNELTNLMQPVLVLASIGWKGTMNAINATSSRIDNPLNTRYWSMVPYQLGLGEKAQAVKYSAASCEQKPIVIPQTDDPNYLRHAMQASLSTGSACMRLMVQPRASGMSVEDPRYEWAESEAPFYEVATIDIPKQQFDEAKKNEACEALSYSPWNALTEHKPLGAVNRMRKAIYQRIDELRRQTAQEGTAAQTSP